MATLKVKSEVTGKVWEVVAQPGQAVAAEETLLVLESMKMEIPVAAPVNGKLQAILVQKDEEVSEGQVLAILET